ncbi:MAG TPA: hypothetical protein VF194_08015 [Ferrovibrio sp.]|uniref:hypothetical protein n=1 Tax=Ferrovibrio sp. TaxID=1917215 RepID=UPI002ED532E4
MPGEVVTPFRPASGKAGAATRSVRPNAAPADLRSYVLGLPNPAQVLAAMAAGFEWVNGVMVEPPVDLPGPMMRFDLNDLYRDL